MSIFVLLAGASTGLMLGILGSGGSIVTMPAFIYLLGVAPKPAIAMSLGVVGLTAGVSALQHGWRGNVNFRIVLIFGLFGAAGTFAGARIGILLPDALQLVMFALIMYAAAYKMIRPNPVAAGGGAGNITGDNDNAPPLRYLHIALHGIIVGILTGIVGVGGGFLIVPALVLLSGLGMKEAIGTSLAIIALKSFAGFAGYAGSVPIDWPLMAVFSAVAITAGVVGGLISHKIPAAILKSSFAVFLLLVASYMLYREISTVSAFN
ncbi:MAG: sulfite exporter TauE/SafE family protein [Alphaproteobacteria bacterium]|nr:sulfite exporter TauE/SafE family protein [Alphaproteobacteria bacterium]